MEKFLRLVVIVDLKTSKKRKNVVDARKILAKITDTLAVTPANHIFTSSVTKQMRKLT